MKTLLVALVLVSGTAFAEPPCRVSATSMHGLPAVGADGTYVAQLSDTGGMSDIEGREVEIFAVGRPAERLPIVTYSELVH